jgi:hypothetical protein
MIVTDEEDAFLLVQGKPFIRIRWLEGIVALHGRRQLRTAYGQAQPHSQVARLRQTATHPAFRHSVEQGDLQTGDVQEAGLGSGTMEIPLSPGFAKICTEASLTVS